MFESIFNIYYTSLDAVFMPLITHMHPAIAILIIAFIVSLIINLATKLLVNQDRMAELKKEIQEFQVKAKKAAKDPELMKQLQEEQQKMMAMQMEMMKMSFKPMIYTWVPIIAIFAYLRHVYGFGGIVHQLNPTWNGVVVHLPLILSKILFVSIFHWLGGIFYHGGFGTVSNEALGWLGWYILCSMATSMILRKVMGIK
ncbi:EMC3/TMCO1 family protein [Methanothermococcus sp.]|uniref:EMC3/TMCO1 family protein n=1 Tax=Methanothermococcus sp. TaxID=2614238 RepID=UPI0025E7E5A5|nr:EMC3/TMCO1 family protein [Methanothermococcus sp.]